MRKANDVDIGCTSRDPQGPHGVRTMRGPTAKSDPVVDPSDHYRARVSKPLVQMALEHKCAFRQVDCVRIIKHYLAPHMWGEMC